MPTPLHLAVLPPVVVAEHGMHAERRFETAERTRPFGVRHGFGVAGNADAGDVVAEQEHAIGSERVDVRDDAFDARHVHPRLAGVQIGDDRELEVEAGRPARRR